MATFSNSSVSSSTYSLNDLNAFYHLPFFDLIDKSSRIHRCHHDPNKVQLSQLLSIKTGGCKEDCKYCPQSVHYKTPITPEKLWDVESITKKAQKAKELGAQRFCLGAAWSGPPKASSQAFQRITIAASQIKDLGLEVCMTLGMLDQDQADALAQSGVDYYNHNLDTSPNYYKKIITTRTYQDRIDTINRVRKSQMKVCCGGIIGMGESITDRLELVLTLHNLDPPPESVPINSYVKVKGTPLKKDPKFNVFDLIKMIAVTRIALPKSIIRLSAGRKSLSKSDQILCFLSGANSIFIGDKLLTTKNSDYQQDYTLFKELGIEHNFSHSID